MPRVEVHDGVEYLALNDDEKELALAGMQEYMKRSFPCPYCQKEVTIKLMYPKDAADA